MWLCRPTMAATLAPHSSHENPDPVLGDTHGPGCGRSYRPRLANLQALGRPANAVAPTRVWASGGTTYPTPPAHARGHARRNRNLQCSGLQAVAEPRLRDSRAADGTGRARHQRHAKQIDRDAATT